MESKENAGERSIAAQRYAREGNYWLNKLSGEWVKSVFPYDFIPTAAGKTGQGPQEEVTFAFPGEWSSALLKLSKGYDYTLHMIFTAVVTLLLDKYTENRDIIVGTTIYRQEKEAEFVNTILPVRTRLNRDMSFKDLLLLVRETILAAVEYQNFPLKSLLSYLGLEFSGQGFPLFGAAVLLDRIHERKYIEAIPIDILFYFRRRPGGIEGVLAYDSSLYRRPTVERLRDHFLRVQQAMIFNIDGKIGAAELLPEEEKQRLLFDFNDTRREYPREKTITRLFENQVEKNRDSLALEYRDRKCTYTELNLRASCLAAQLRERGVNPDSTVALRVERSLAMLIGIMGILKAGGAYLPLDTDLPPGRLDYMLKDSNAKILVTTGTQAEEGEKVRRWEGEKDFELIFLNTPFSPILLNPDLPNFLTSQLPIFHLLPATGHPSPATSLAYIIYTSGSSGEPKAAMVDHYNLHHLVLGLRERIYRSYGPALKVGLIAPYFFDASVKQIFGALLQGHCLSIVPEGTRVDGRRLLEYYAANHLDISDGTPTHLRLMLESMPGSEFSFFVRHFIIGGEALAGKVVEDFFKAFRGKTPKITNIYGVTECTVDSASYEITRESPIPVSMFPLGKPMLNTVICILNSENRLQPIGIAGEMALAGEGPGRGYLNNPELTHERFLLFSRSDSIPGPYPVQKLYKTGDLGRWLSDGNIEFLGRKDYQVKIRGNRLELGEIRGRLLRLPGIKDAAVVVNTGKNQDQFLCAYVVPGQEGDWSSDALRKHLSQFMPDYMIPVHFVNLDKIPLTPNGKVDRKALPAWESVVKGEYTAPRDSIEEKLARTWSELLDLAYDRIGIDANFFELGGHSLKATIMSARVHRLLDVEIPLLEVFKTPHIRGLAQLIKESRPREYAPLALVEEKEYYPMSPAVRRLYFEQQLNPGNVNYNVTMSYWLEGHLDRKRLEHTLTKITRRHQSLRTAFVSVGDRPVQRIHDHVDINLQYYDLSKASLTPREPGKSETIEIDEILENFVQAFDLGKAPLLKAGLVKIHETKHVLLVDLHHLVCDGTSVGLLASEFMALYSGEKLGPLPLQYKDYTGWKTGPLHRALREKQEKYWLSQFRQEVTVLNLPFDYPRPARKSSRGLAVSLPLEVEETQKLKNLALQQKVTLYMLLAAIYNVFLSKLSGEEDIVIGTPSAGRGHTRLEPLIGMFVNTLVLRNYPRGNQNFNDFLKEIKERTLDVFANQEYNFESLVQRVVTARDLSRSPITDVFFALQNMFLPDLYIPGLTLKQYRYNRKVARYDLSFILLEGKTRLWLYVEYCTELFKEQTIQRFIGWFRKIAASVIHDPRQKIKQIQLIPEEEKHRLLYEFNDTRTAYPENQTIHALFARQAEKTPDQIALGGIHETHEKNRNRSHLSHLSYTSYLSYMSYTELNEKSNRLAHFLVEEGLKPGNIAGIMVEPCVEVIIGILAILKAGAAYLPIEPEYPQKRIDYMLGDSAAKMTLTMNTSANAINYNSHRADFLTRHPGSLAYIIYTSGTSGKPKGVMIQHRNVIRLVKNSNYIEFTPGDRLLLTGAFVFDITTFEIYWPLLNGLSLFLANREIILAAEKLEHFLLINKISILHLIPQLFNQLADQRIGIFSRLRYFLVGGDLVRPQYVNLLRNMYTNLKILHMYGPTENTTFSTYFPVEEDFEVTIPVGKPIGNSTVYILDKYGRLQPLGVVGELCAGGDGVARGYLNNPELTFEKFVSDFNRSHFSYVSYKSKPRLYKTGDLSRWQPDGNIEFLGRIDQQVKIRGIRVEPGEIESQLLKHEKIKEAAVVVRHRDVKGGEGYLGAYIVPVGAAEVDEEELTGYLAAKLPQYMIPAYFISLEKIPLTPNGKLDKKALPVPGRKPGEDYRYIPPGNALEEKLSGIWSGVLNIPTPGIDDNFFKSGGHSLKAALMVSRIHRAFHVNLPLLDFFNNPSIRQLANYLGKARQEKHRVIDPVEKRDSYPLSPAQKRLYFLQCLDPRETTYNIPLTMMLEGRIDIPLLEKTFKHLVRQHESLRTRFVLVKGEPVQVIHDEVEFNIEYYDNQVTGADDNSFLRPFDLSKAPLLRVRLIKTGKNRHIFMVDMHHIISDGASMGILLNRFLGLYTCMGQESLPRTPIRYKDYSQWQNSPPRREIIKKQETYWLNRYQGEKPVLKIPTDYPRPGIKSNKGAYEQFKIEGDTVEKLKALALREDATMFMVMLTIFNILLHKLTNQEDIILGTVTAGRRHADLENVMGMFVNTLVLRNYPQEKKSVIEFLREVRAQTLETFDNQDYPFDDLVEKVVEKRDPTRNPLFDVLFIFGQLDTGATLPPLAKTGLKVKPHGPESNQAKFDMLFSGVAREEELVFSIGYCTELFKKETIRRYINYFKEIISNVKENEGMQLKNISISHDLAPAEADLYRDRESNFEFCGE